MVDGNAKKLVLNSDFEEINQLEPYLESLRKDLQISEEKFPQIRLAVNEAVTNAIDHGNKNDPSKKVYISATLDGKQLIISVRDEGEGFDPDELDDPQLRADGFTITDVPGRLKKRGDPWRGMGRHGVSLTTVRGGLKGV